MTARALLWLAGWCAISLAHAGAIDLRQRSDSASRQFTIYCEDVPLRLRAVSFAEEVKADVLALLGENTHATEAPIVITLERAALAERTPPAPVVRLVETQPGFKIEINAKIGDDPSAVNLQKQIVRALLLEYAYRDTEVTGGMAFREAPWWVIEGAIEITRRRERGIDSELFKRIVETNKLPPIEDFLIDKPDELGPAARAIDRALAMCLVQLLVEQNGGRASLARLVRDWPQSNGDQAALLLREFPALAAGKQTLQKWWTVNLARFAAADRYKGLTAEETEKQLAPLLEVELAVNKAGEKKKFALGDFARFIKQPASRAALAQRHGEIIALAARANALYRPVLTDYEQILALLSRGKTRGVGERIARVEHYRTFVVRRSVEIADYLNWYEATQMTGRSDTFDNYLKTANELEEQSRKHTDPIGRYLDEFEQEF